MNDALNIYKRAWYHISKDWLATIKIFLLLTILSLLFDALINVALNNARTKPELIIYDALIELNPFLSAIFTIITYLIYAVNFHRYVLKNETPSWIPRLNTIKCAGYFFRVIFLSLIFIIIGTVFFVMSNIIGNAVITFILCIPLIVLASYYVIRLSPSLAAYAIGDAFGFSDALKKSSQYKMTFLWLALIYLGTEIIGEIFQRIAASASISIAMNTLIAILAIAVITASYEFLRDQDQGKANDNAS